MKLTASSAIEKAGKATIYLSTFAPFAAFAQDPACDPKTGSATNGAECAKAASQPQSLFAQGGVFETISNILIFLVGAIAVIMLIWGGLQYVISAGDSKRVENAKSTILYSIIGIVIALLAFAIVNFVTGQLSVQPA